MGITAPAIPFEEQYLQHPEQFRDGFSTQDLLISKAKQAIPDDVNRAENKAALEHAWNLMVEWGIYDNYDEYGNLDLGKYAVNRAHYDETSIMSTYLYPNTPPERLVVPIVFNTIGYYLDDTFGQDKHSAGTKDRKEDKGEFLKGLAAGIQNPQHYFEQLNLQPGDLDYDNFINRDPKVAKLVGASVQFFQMVHDMSNPEFTHRFVNNVFAHWDLSFRLEDYTPASITEFINIRRLLGGMDPTVDMIEFCSQQYVPQYVRDVLPGFLPTLEAINDVGALSNEIYSYPKEVLDQGTQMNLVAVIQKLEGCSLQQATAIAIDIVNQRTAEFGEAANILDEQAEEILQNDPPEHTATKRYIQGLRHMVWASHMYQTKSLRYRHPEHIIRENRTNDRVFDEKHSQLN